MSYSCFMNILIGGRGVGKTTRLILYAMNRYIKKGEQFIYLRRYRPEVKEFVGKEVLNNLYDGIYLKGTGGGDSYTIFNENNTVGYIFPLSSQSKFKSTVFDKVTTIIFDEVFLEKGRVYYIPQEVTNFFQLVSTVQRTRSNLKLFLLSNNNSTFNPYFTYFNVPEFKSIYTDKERGLYIEKIPINPKLLELEQVTPLYKLTAGTAYGNYHYANEVLREVEVIVTPEKPKQANYWITTIVNGQPLSFYKVDGKEEMLWVITQSGKNLDRIYTLVCNDKVNMYYARLFKMRFIDTLRYYFGTGKILYQSNRAYDMLQYIFGVIK